MFHTPVEARQRYHRSCLRYNVLDKAFPCRINYILLHLLTKMVGIIRYTRFCQEPLWHPHRDWMLTYIIIIIICPVDRNTPSIQLSGTHIASHVRRPPSRTCTLGRSLTATTFTFWPSGRQRTRVCSLSGTKLPYHLYGNRSNRTTAVDVNKNPTVFHINTWQPTPSYNDFPLMRFTKNVCTAHIQHSQNILSWCAHFLKTRPHSLHYTLLSCIILLLTICRGICGSGRIKDIMLNNLASL